MLSDKKKESTLIILLFYVVDDRVVMFDGKNNLGFVDARQNINTIYLFNYYLFFIKFSVTQPGLGLAWAWLGCDNFIVCFDNMFITITVNYGLKNT